MGSMDAMIRSLAFLLVLLVAMVLDGPRPAAAQPVPDKPALQAAPINSLAVKDRLFARLKAAQTPAEARLIADKIQRQWQYSGSDTVDLLSRRAAMALTQNDAALSMELLDRMIALKPDWSEAYFQRALVFLLLDDQSRAVADIGRVLQKEPRHYIAMLTLAALLQKQEQKKPAYDLYQEVLRFYPLNETAQTQSERLKTDVRGRDL